MSREPLDRRELRIMSAAFAFLLLLPLLVPRLHVLLTKPLWLDELYTWLLARDLPGPELVARLSRGGDMNPPVLFVVDSMMLRLFSFAPPQVVLRLTSVLSIWLACVLLYRISRQWMSAAAAAIGVVALLSHPALLGQLHEARFYAPWCLLIVAVTWSMQRVHEQPASWPRRVQLALLTAATCLIHYFGVLSLGCVALGYLLATRSVARAKPVIASMAVGMLALVAWMPVYAAQRRVLSVPTWVSPATIGTSLTYVYRYLAWWPFAALLAMVALDAVLRRDREERGSLSVAQAAVLGLLALPLVLIAFAFLIQPALVSRYALPTVAGLGVVAALAADRLSPRVQRVILAGFVVLHAVSLMGRAEKADEFRRSMTGGVAAANLLAADARPVLMLEPFLYYPVALSSVNRNDHLFMPDVPSDTARRWLAERDDAASWINFVIALRDGGRAHESLFGFPRYVRLDSMRRFPSFFVVTEVGDTTLYPNIFAGYRACRAHERLLLFTTEAGLRQSKDEIRRSAPCPPGTLDSTTGQLSVRSSSATALTPRR